MARRIRGFLAMEEAEVTVGEIEVAVVPAEVEQSVAEVTEQASEIEDDTQAMEDAVEDAAVLDDMVDVAQDTVDAGVGMEPVAAEMADIAVESIYARLGVVKSTPSMEAFGSSSTRVHATRLAIEDWKDKVKEIWKKVSEWFVALWNKIKTFLADFYLGNDRLAKAADAMKARIAEISNKKAAESTFEDKGIANAFGEGSGATFGKADAAIKNHIAATAGFVGSFGDFLKAVDSTSAAGVEKAAGKPVDLEAKIKSGVNTINSKLKAALKETSGSKDIENGVESGLFATGMTISFTSSGKTVALTISEGKTSSNTKNNVLTPAEMTTLCDVTKELTVTTGEYRKKQATVEAIINSTVKMSKAIAESVEKVNTAAGNNTEGSAKSLFDLRSFMTSAGSTLSKLATSIPSTNVRAGKAALTYVGNSISQYKEAEKAKEEPKTA